MAKYYSGSTQKIFVTPENTFGVPVPPSAADAIAHMTIAMDYKETRVSRDDRKGTKGVREMISREKKTTFNFDGYIVPSGVEAQKPDISDMLETIFGTPITTGAGTISSCTTTGAVISDPSAIDVGQIMGVVCEDGIQRAVYITANPPISGAPSGVLSWLPVLPSAPVEGSAVVRGIVYPSVSKNSKSFSLAQMFDDPVAYTNIGCKPESMDIKLSGKDEAKITIKGFCKDQIMALPTTLTLPMKANYAFSESGDGAALPDGTHKSFMLSVAGDTPEQVDLLGTEPTWAAVVNTLNTGVLSGLSETHNKAAVAVAKADGFYIRAGSTGNGKDVVITNSATNNYTVVGVLGVAGIELDADEAVVYGGIEAGMVVDAGSESLTVLAVSQYSGSFGNGGDLITVTRGTPAAHAVGDAIGAHDPGQVMSGSPITGFSGELILSSLDFSDTGGPVVPIGTILKTLDTSIALVEGVKAIEGVMGSQTPVGIFSGGKRTVNVKASAYLTDQEIGYLMPIKDKARMSCMAQAGDANGMIAIFFPKLEFVSLPSPDTSTDDAVKYPLEAVAMETNGNDEMILAFIK